MAESSAPTRVVPVEHTSAFSHTILEMCRPYFRHERSVRKHVSDCDTGMTVNYDWHASLV